MKNRDRVSDGERRHSGLRFSSLKGLRLALGIVTVSLAMSAVRAEPLPLANYPDAEKKLAHTVDPWGLAFNDQMDRFQSYFKEQPKAEFAAGWTHSAVKVWPNKYWFRGVTVPAGASSKKVEPLWGVTGSTVSFQVAVLPKIGAAQAKYKIEAKSSVPVTVWRQEFVKLGAAAYPRFESDRWPDPLVPEKSCEVAGTDLGVFLVEVAIPKDFKESSLTCNVFVSNGRTQTAKFTVPVEVVPLEIHPKELPLTAWFLPATLTDAQFDDMCALCLENHVQPLAGDVLKKYWKPDSSADFDRQVEKFQKLGQNTFLLWGSPDVKTYEHLKERGWLSQFIIQGNTDEPLEDAFNKNCIPYAEAHRKKFPGLRLFLATECHPRIAEGVDIVWTDLSTSKYDPRTFVVPKGLEVWHYYCHLPIGCQLRAPIYRAPNMEIDNTALEHRVALWMSGYYRAKGIFIWAGNFQWSDLGTDFWKKLDLSSDTYRNSAQHPYGGTHYGNGFLVYPPRETGGKVLPSLRMKVLRDGMEDVAILKAAQKKFGRDSDAWLSPVPEVFQHPQYFDTLPETLLSKRTEILKRIRKAGGSGE